MQLREKIYNLRKVKNITQAELYQKLGKKNSNAYEQNLKNPDIKFLKKLSSIFNVSVDYLIDNETAGRLDNVIAEKPELYQYLEALMNNKELQLLLEEAQQLKPKTIKKIIEIARVIEDEN